MWHHNPSDVVPVKTLETQAVKAEKHHEVATTLYVPIPVSLADHPPAFHGHCSYYRRKV
jgi:hypothetical protein